MVDHFSACHKTLVNSTTLLPSLLHFCNILAVSRTDTPDDRKIAACALKQTAFLGFIIANYKNGGKVQKHTRHRFAPSGGKIFISTKFFI